MSNAEIYVDQSMESLNNVQDSATEAKVYAELAKAAALLEIAEALRDLASAAQNGWSR